MIRNNLLRIAISVLLAFMGSVYASDDQQKTVTPSSAALSSAAADNSGQQVPALQQRYPRYQVERGDVLALSFPLTPEFNETATVQPDGYISLVGLSAIHAQGQSLPELEQSLRSAYAKILHDPIITVTLQTFVTPSFTAYGEVGKPGKYDLHGDTTVSQAVAIAGSFTENAKHSQVLLFRRISPDTVEAKKIDLKHMLKSRNMAEDIHLQPGDMLFIPKNAISKIRPFIPWNAFRAGYSIPNN